MWYEVFQGATAESLPAAELVAFLDETDEYVQRNLRVEELRHDCLSMRELAGQIRMLHLIASDRGVFDPQVNLAVQSLCGFWLAAKMIEKSKDSLSGAGKKGGQSSAIVRGREALDAVASVLKDTYGDKRLPDRFPTGTARKILQRTKLDRTEQQVNAILRKIRKRSATLSEE